jgi:preprotein translocase subunit SecD
VKLFGGNSQIAGNFTIEEAEELALKISTGSLPELEIMSETMVSPN